MTRRVAVMALTVAVFLASLAVLTVSLLTGPGDVVLELGESPPRVRPAPLALAEPAATAATAAATVTVAAQRGDTLAGLLAAAGSDAVAAADAVAALAGIWDARRLQVGQRVHIALAGGGEGAQALDWFAVALDEGGYVIARRQRTAGFLAAIAARLPDGASLPATEETAAAAVRVLAAGRGDTLMEIALRAGAARSDADRAIRALSRLIDPAALQIGQRLQLALAATDSGPRLAAIALELGDGRFAIAERLPSGGYTASHRNRPLAAAAPGEERSEEQDERGGDALRVQRLALQAGDTLMNLLLAAGASREEAGRAIVALRPHYDLRRLQIGQEVAVAFEGRALAAVAVAIGDGLHVQAALQEGAFVASRTATPIAAAPPAIVAEASPGEKDRQIAAADRQAPEQEVAAGAVALSPRAEQAWLVAREGDTLAGLLRLLGGREDEADRIVAALAGHGGSLAAGRQLVVVTDEDDAGLRIVALSLDREGGGMVVAWRLEDGSFATGEAMSHIDLADFMPPAPADDEAAWTPPPGETAQTAIEIAAGGTLAQELLALGIDPVESDRAIDALREVFNPRRIRAGQIVEVAHDGARLAGFTLAFAPGQRAEVARDGEAFHARLAEVALQRRLTAASGHIESSLYGAALAAGVPQPVLAATIRAYSFDVDFQREIRTGDSFTLLYERFVDEAGRTLRHGAPLHAVLRLSGRVLPIYRFTPQSGFDDYFNRSGESVRKALLRTPIDRARITSSYGMRTLFGYTRMHKGVDFGAPTGTPILAAGDGVVDYVGRNGAYGNYVRLRHNSTYKTAYAHMSRFASGLARGARVRQGEIIGYVGSSGRSTGPHLHYEVLVNDERIDPQSLRLPAGEILAGEELARFQAERERLDRLLAGLLQERLPAGSGP